MLREGYNYARTNRQQAGRAIQSGEDTHTIKLLKEWLLR